MAVAANLDEFEVELPTDRLGLTIKYLQRLRVVGAAIFSNVTRNTSKTNPKICQIPGRVFANSFHAPKTWHQYTALLSLRFVMGIK